MGSGFRTFAPGEVLTGSNVQNYLMEQAVMSFINAADRDTKVTTPEDGMVAFLRDVDALTVYAGGAWIVAMYVNGAQAYTPVWTAATTAPSLNNGSVVGLYQQFGKSVQVYARLTIGSSTTFGSGQYRLSLPSVPGTPSTTTNHIIGGQYLDSSAGVYYPGQCQVAAGGFVNMQMFSVTGTDIRTINIAPTVPVAWGAGDIFYIFGMYEVA